MNEGFANGDNPNSYTIDTSFALVAPTDVDGYVFEGWFYDASFSKPASQVIQGTTGDKTFYAKWSKKTYRIMYLADNNSQGAITDQFKEHGVPFTLESAGYFNRKGYGAQTGWATEAEGAKVYEFGASYEENAPLTVYPSWGDPIVYTITYVCEGCENNSLNPETYTVLTNTGIKYASSVPAGYKFGGWFSDKKYTKQVTQIVAGTIGNMTLYGKLNKIYKITYVGTDKPRCDTLYTVDDKITLRNPADSAGYIFGGWYTNANFEGDAVTSIAKGSTGDTTFYAKWIPEVETVQYGAITIYTYASDGHKEAVIDGSSIETIDIPDGFDVTSVVYDRTFAAGKYSTIVLPFDIDVSNVPDATFYGLSGVTKQDGKWKDVQVYEITSGNLSANTPYIVKTTGSTITFNGSVSFASTQALNSAVVNNEDGSRWVFKPSYEKIVFGELPEIGRAYGFAAEDKDGAKIGSFVKAGHLAWMRPMRAYLVYEGGTGANGAAKSALGSGFEAELPDEINVVVQDEQGNVVERGVLNTRTGEIRMDSWYDLQGRKLNRKPETQGNYYHNGSRVIVK